MESDAVLSHLDEHGWVRLGYDEKIAAWANSVRPAATACLTDPAFEQWHRSEGTWFVGVNALANDEQGRVGDGPPLPQFLKSILEKHVSSAVKLDRGQVSAVFQGFPRQGQDSDAAYRYRVRRDGAHVDGLHKVDGKRILRETHSFLLGIPLTDAGPLASPVVVWDKSHDIMRDAFARRLDDTIPENWDQIDLTEAYTSARRLCFETCKRIELPARPGEAYIIHRLALHGVSPWRTPDQAESKSRIIVYFRPALDNPREWLA